MGEIVDLDAFRKQREEEEEAKARAEAEAKAAEEQAEIDYMRDVLHRIMVNLSDSLTGSMMLYTGEDAPSFGYDGYSSDDYTFNSYYHEAGYDEDGYYERSWEFDPREEEEPDDDF